MPHVPCHRRDTPKKVYPLHVFLIELFRRTFPDSQRYPRGETTTHDLVPPWEVSRSIHHERLTPLSMILQINALREQWPDEANCFSFGERSFTLNLSKV